MSLCIFVASLKKNPVVSIRVLNMLKQSKHISFYLLTLRMLLKVRHNFVLFDFRSVPANRHVSYPFVRKHLRAMYIINSIKLLFYTEEVFFEFQNLILT